MMRRLTWSPLFLGNPRSGRSKHWKNQSSNKRISFLINLVLISGPASDSHDPRGDQWIIQSWGLEMIQQDPSGVRSAFGWSSQRYWFHIQLCNWPWGSHCGTTWFSPKLACETRPSPGGAWSPGGSRPWESREIVPAQMVLFLLFRKWEMDWAPPLWIFTLSASSLPRNQGQGLFGGTWNSFHVRSSWCVVYLHGVSRDFSRLHKFLMSNLQ